MSVNLFIENVEKTLPEYYEIEPLKPTHKAYKRTCEIYAHQGFAGSSHKNAVSNTVSALYEALNAGCNGMETDIRQTSDGIMVINHNEDVTGTVNGETVTRTIATSTLAELKEILLGTSQTYGDIHINTLDELLQVAAYTGMKLLLEYKGGDVKNIPKAVMRMGMQDRVTYMCNHTMYSEVASIDKHASFAYVSFAYGSISDFSDFTPHLTDSNSISLDYVATSDTEPDFTNLYAAQEAGLSIDFWNFTGNTLKLLDVNPKHITINTNIISTIDNYIAQKQLV